MKTRHSEAAKRPKRGSTTPEFSTADHITGTYPGGPTSSRRPSEAHPEGAAIRGIADVEASRERLVLRQRRRRRLRHAFEVLLIGLALALSTGVYLGFEAHTSLEKPIEKVIKANGDIDLSDEMRWLLEELWRMEDMERLPRR